MNVRIKYLMALLGISLAAVLLMMVTALQLTRFPGLRWALLAEWVAVFVAVFWLQRHFRGRLSRPTRDGTLKGARAARKLSWMYFGGLVFGLLAGGRQLLSLPYGLGLVGPLVVISLGTYYMRLSIKLNRAAAKAEGADQGSA